MSQIITLRSLFLAILTIGCSGAETSMLNKQAVHDSQTSDLIRVKDGEAIKYVFVSNGKGYELQCANAERRKSLILATGYTYEFLFDNPPLPVDSEKVQSFRISEQPALKCESSDRFLFKSVLDDQTKYFIADSARPTRLFMLGCQALVDAMGFNLGEAHNVPSYLIDPAKSFSVDDVDDINCIKGTPVGTPVTWTLSGPADNRVTPASSIGVFTVSATRPDGRPSPVDMIKVGHCDWLQGTSVNEALILTGDVPSNFFQADCKVTLIVEKGNYLESERVLTFSNNSVAVCESGLELGFSKTSAIPHGNLTITCTSSGNGGFVDAYDGKCANSQFSFDTETKVCKPTGPWARDSVSDTNLDGTCDGVEECVYIHAASLVHFTKSEKTIKYWSDANDSCETLAVGGYSDWRLPTKNALFNVARGIDRIWSLKQVLNLGYEHWAGDGPNSEAAYIVDLETGHWYHHEKGAAGPGSLPYPKYYICVR